MLRSLSFDWLQHPPKPISGIAFPLDNCSTKVKLFQGCYKILKKVVNIAKLFPFTKKARSSRICEIPNCCEPLYLCDRTCLYQIISTGVRSRLNSRYPPDYSAFPSFATAWSTICWSHWALTPSSTPPSRGCPTTLPFLSST